MLISLSWCLPSQKVSFLLSELPTKVFQVEHYFLSQPKLLDVGCFLQFLLTYSVISRLLNCLCNFSTKFTTLRRRVESYFWNSRFADAIPLLAGGVTCESFSGLREQCVGFSWINWQNVADVWVFIHLESGCGAMFLQQPRRDKLP